MHESWLYNPAAKYKIIYSLLIILPLNPEALPSFRFSVFYYSLTNSDMKKRGTRNGSSRENDSMMRVLQGMIERQQKQMESFFKDYWLHPWSRSQTTCQILEDYSRWSFRAWRKPWMQSSGWWHERSSEGIPGLWREPDGSNQDSVEGCG